MYTYPAIVGHSEARTTPRVKGNRSSTLVDTTWRYYCTNNVNQYESLDPQSGCPKSNPDESVGYDDDGNLTGDAKYAYTWDAENP